MDLKTVQNDHAVGNEDGEISKISRQNDLNFVFYFLWDT